MKYGFMLEHLLFLEFPRKWRASVWEPNIWAFLQVHVCPSRDLYYVTAKGEGFAKTMEDRLVRMEAPLGEVVYATSIRDLGNWCDANLHTWFCSADVAPGGRERAVFPQLFDARS